MLRRQLGAIRHVSTRPTTTTTTTRQSIRECPAPKFDTGCTHCMPDDMAMFEPPDKPFPPTPFHTKHLLIHTGHADWPSRLDGAIADLGVLRRTVMDQQQATTALNEDVVLMHNTDLPLPGAHLYPDGVYFDLDLADKTQLWSLAHAVFGGGGHPGGEKIANPMVLVCGHGQRDERCGIMGPLLINELRRVLDHHGMLYNKETNPAGVLVGQCSHVGGHAFAGNMVIHDGEGNEPIWYSRVFPPHVQGIVEQTLLSRTVIESLKRK